MANASVRVSVVTAVRNGGPTVAASLAGVLGQEAPAFEVIVIDDGSTDETPRILAEAASRDSRITVLRTDGEGLTAALCRGIAAASGDYIARHDLDDVSLPGRFSAQVAGLDARPDIAALGTAADIIDERGRRVGAFPTVSGPDAVRRGLLTLRATPVHGAMMIRRSVLQAVGTYRTAFTAAQDYDLWLRMTDRHAIDILPTPFYQWRLNRASTYAQRRSEQLQLAGIARVFADERAQFGEDSYAALVAAAGNREQFAAGYRCRGRLEAWWGELLYRGLNDPRVARKHLTAALKAGTWRPRTFPLWLWASAGLPWPGRSPLSAAPEVAH